MQEKGNKFEDISDHNDKEHNKSHSSKDRRIPERKPSRTTNSIMKTQIKAFSSLKEGFGALK